MLASAPATPRGNGSGETGGGISSAELEVNRVRAELAAARVTIEAAEVKAKQAVLAQRDAERSAANSAASAAASQQMAEELRLQLFASRQETTGCQQRLVTYDDTMRREVATRAELTAVKSQLRAKWEEAEVLRMDAASAKTQLEQRQALFARRELEMRAVRSRALAMVKALRQATASLGSEHASAHAVLDGHFRMLETSVQWEDILGAAP